MRRALSRMLGGMAKKLDKKSAKTAADGGLPASFERYRDYIRIDPTAIIAPNAALAIPEPPKTPTVMLEVGAGSHIFSTFTLLRPTSRITVGRDCQLGASQFIAATSITVGDDVIMAWSCTVMDTDNHAIDWTHRRFDVARCRQDWLETNGASIARSHDWEPVGMGAISIGSKSWLGFGTAVLKNVTVGEGAVIGAASVVTRDVPSWSVAGGNPCRVLKRAPRPAERAEDGSRCQ